MMFDGVCACAELAVVVDESQGLERVRKRQKMHHD
jgi:hypothetical protein